MRTYRLDAEVHACAAPPKTARDVLLFDPDAGLTTAEAWQRWHYLGSWARSGVAPGELGFRQPGPNAVWMEVLPALTPVMSARAPTWTAEHPPGVQHYGTSGFEYGERWATVICDHTERALLFCHGAKGQGYHQTAVRTTEAKAVGERWVLYGSVP